VVSAGNLSFDLKIDPSNLRGEAVKIENLLKQNPLLIPISLDVDSRATRQAQDRIQSQFSGQTVQIKPEVDTRGIRSVKETVEQVQKAAKDSAAQIKRLQDEFGLTAQEAKKVQTELARSEREAKKLADQAQRVEFKRQQREAAALANELAKAERQAKQLQAQTAKDNKILKGSNFNSREIKRVERALKSVTQENRKAQRTAALLRQQYGLTDDEIEKILRKLGILNKETNKFNAALAGFAGAGAFLALDAAIDALRGTIRALVGVAVEAVQEFGKFEESLNSFAARSQGTNVDLAALEAQIKSVAQATSFSPAGLADAATQLVALGVPATEVEGRLDSLAKTADVLGENPVITGRVLQGALEQYAAFGESADSVSDILVKLINTTAAGSRSGIAEFEQLFSRAAPTAAALGVELEVLAAAFAGLRQTGATAQVASSTIDAVLTRIATEKEALEQAGITVQFNADGALDFEGTLLEIRSRVEEIKGTAADPVDFLAGIFGRERGGDVLALLNSLDGAFGTALESANSASGELERTFEIVSQGILFQAGILEGQYKTALTEVGLALSPLASGFIELGQSIFETANVDLSSLSEAADRLGAALGDNPELAERLGEALSNLAQTGVDQFSILLDALTAFAGNQDAIDGFAQSIEDIGIAIEFIVRIAQGLIGVTELFFQQGSALETLDSNLQRTVPLYRALADAIKLIGAAFEFLKTPLQSTGDLVESLASKFDILANNPVIQALIAELQGATAVASDLGGEIDNLASQQNRALANAGQQVKAEQIRESQPEIPVVDSAPTETETQKATDALKELRAEQDAILSDIELRATESESALIGQGASEEQVAARERQTLQERLTARESFLADLNAINTDGLSVEDAASIEQQIAQTEQAIANDRLAIAQSVRDGKIAAAEEAADKAIEAIEKERDAESERANASFETETRQLQRNFDDQSEARKLANEEKINGIKEESEARIEARKQSFADAQRREDEAFQAQQQEKERKFQKELQDFQNAESGRIDAAATEAEFQTELRLAETPEDRDRLLAERESAQERAKILAEEQEKALRNTDQGLELTPIQEARLALEEEVAARQLEFTTQQNAEQKAFELQQLEEKRAFETSIDEEKKATALEIQGLEKQFNDNERAIEDAFEQQMRDREAEFNAEQRRLDEESARRIEQIKSNASQGIAPQSLRGGGVVQGTGKVAPVQVHADEFMFAPVGTRVVSQMESRRLVADHLAANLPGLKPTPNISLPPLPNVSSSFNSASQSVSALASRDRKLMEVLEDIRDNALNAPGGNYYITTQKPEIDIAYLERQRQRLAARRAGY
jgi:TP901 family phage tail tape measure protein